MGLDLSADAAPILQQLPGVAKVERLAAVDRPKCRIVHVRDWHFVPRDLFALDLEAHASRKLSTEEVDAYHENLLLEVELVQLEQAALLRCLAKHHGLKEVWAEGVTRDNRQQYQEHVKATAAAEKEVRHYQALLALVGSKQAREAERVQADLEKLRVQWLKLGACGRLLAEGDLEKVLPLTTRNYPPSAR